MNGPTAAAAAAEAAAARGDFGCAAAAPRRRAEGAPPRPAMLWHLTAFPCRLPALRRSPSPSLPLSPPLSLSLSLSLSLNHPLTHALSLSRPLSLALRRSPTDRRGRRGWWRRTDSDATERARATRKAHSLPRVDGAAVHRRGLC